MNRTIREATVQRCHYDSHELLRAHLGDFIAAYNFTKRLKTLGGLTVYQFIGECWQKEPDRFTLDPIHQMPGQTPRTLCSVRNVRVALYIGIMTALYAVMQS